MIFLYACRCCLDKEESQLISAAVLPPAGHSRNLRPRFPSTSVGILSVFNASVLDAVLEVSSGRFHGNLCAVNVITSSAH